MSVLQLQCNIKIFMSIVKHISLYLMVGGVIMITPLVITFAAVGVPEIVVRLIRFSFYAGTFLSTTGALLYVVYLILRRVNGGK